MKGILIIVFIILTYITSCQIEITSQGTYKELSRDYSPDSSTFILKYNYAQGAWDGGRTWFYTLVNKKDTSDYKKNHSYSSLDIDNIYWKGNDTIIMEENFTEFLSEGKAKLRDTIQNGIIIKIIQKDPIDKSYTRKIIYKETSPNKQFDLLVYRYVKPENGHYFLNISIVGINDTIPKFGNFYVSKFGFDCFEDIKWDNSNSLDIKVSESCFNIFENYLVKNKVPVKYKVKADSGSNSKGNIDHNSQY